MDKNDIIRDLKHLSIIHMMDKDPFMPTFGIPISNKEKSNLVFKNKNKKGTYNNVPKKKVRRRTR